LIEALEHLLHPANVPRTLERAQQQLPCATGRDVHLGRWS
jgi:hypothetical protein